MADGLGTALGMSIGATNLAAVTATNAITRKPVLTLFRQRPPEVGVPAENPRLDEPGLVVTDFVDRVGDKAGIVAADGSLHRSEALIADGLRALAYAATGGSALPDNVAVTYPAHWPEPAVETLGASLSRVSEWSNRARPLMLIPDAAAALFAVRADPGIPAGGTIAVCDFGGGGASITLMDAAGDYRALAPTVRHHGFSGNLIDQALLTAVMGNLPSGGSFDPASTLASGSLNRLRTDCRSAKEQLSASTVTTLADDLPGMHGDFRLTRDELNEVIREPLNHFLTVLEQTLARNGIQDLVAVVAVGGGANIPAVTTTLSGRLHVPVVSTPRPHLTPALGAAMRAARGRDSSSTAAAVMASPAAPMASTATAQALAWPRRNNSGVVPFAAQDTMIRPALEPEAAAPLTPEPTRIRWYRRVPAMAAIAAFVVLVVAGSALAVALSHPDEPMTATHSPGTSTPPSAAPPPAGPAPTQEAPPPSTTDTNPPAMTETPTPPTTGVPPATPQARRPVAGVPMAPAAPLLPQIPELPPLPPIPGINEPIPGLDRVNQILRELEAGQLPR